MISWYPIPRLIGRYLFFDFLGSENSFQAKGEIEEEKGETTTEANEKEEEIKEEIFWSHASLYFQGRFLSLSLQYRTSCYHGVRFCSSDLFELDNKKNSQAKVI